MLLHSHPKIRLGVNDTSRAQFLFSSSKICFQIIVLMRRNFVVFRHNSFNFQQAWNQVTRIVSYLLNISAESWCNPPKYKAINTNQVEFLLCWLRGFCEAWGSASRTMIILWKAACKQRQESVWCVCSGCDKSVILWHSLTYSSWNISFCVHLY